jgi:hypothetical protein
MTSPTEEEVVRRLVGRLLELAAPFLKGGHEVIVE